MIRVTEGEAITVSALINKNRRAQDISTWDVKAAIRRTNDGDVLKPLTVTKTVTGAFTVELDVSGILPGQYVLAIRVAAPTGFIRTFNESILIKKDLNW